MTHSTSAQVRYRSGSIDDLLGDGRSRFFGTGFRHVRQTVGEIDIDPEGGVVSAVARMSYPSNWSTKSGGELEAHLSTLDGLVIAAQLGEAFVRTAHALDEEQVARMFLSRVVLKSGVAPTLDLSRVVINGRVKKMGTSDESIGGRLTELAFQIGGMRVEVALDHAGGNMRGAPSHFASLAEVVGPPEDTYYGGLYRQEGIVLRDIAFCSMEDEASAALDLDSPFDPNSARGLGAAYAPSVTPAHVIVCLAQLSQALMYRYDGITRDQSHNLWMRKVVMQARRPVPAGTGLEAYARVVKASRLNMKDKVWRVCSFAGHLPGISVEHNLAHQLPNERTLRSVKRPRRNDHQQV